MDETKELIKKAFTAAKSSGSLSPRHIFNAAMMGNDRKFQEIVLANQNALDFNARDVYGDSVLILASREGNENIVKFLLSVAETHAVDIDQRNAQGATALHLAAEFNRAMIVSHLLHAGADLTLEDASGCSALELAASTNSVDTLKILLPFAEPNTAVSVADRTALHYAAAGGHIESCRLLLDKKIFNVNAADSNHLATPLHMCCLGGTRRHTLCALYLIERGARLESKNAHGMSAVEIARSVDCESTASELLAPSASALQELRDILSQCDPIDLQFDSLSNQVMDELVALHSQESVVRSTSLLPSHKEIAEAAYFLSSTGTALSPEEANWLKAENALLKERLLQLLE